MFKKDITFTFLFRIGETLPEEVQLQSGILSYHHWFLGGVSRWQERLFSRTRTLVTKEVEKDDFVMDSSGISLSASESKANFTIVSVTRLFIDYFNELGKGYTSSKIYMLNKPTFSVW